MAYSSLLEYWYPVMQALRSVNEQLARRGRPYLSEELLLMTQSHLRAEGDKIGCRNDWRDLSDHVKLLMPFKMSHGQRAPADYPRTKD